MKIPQAPHCHRRSQIAATNVAIPMSCCDIRALSHPCSRSVVPIARASAAELLGGGLDVAVTMEGFADSLLAQQPEHFEAAVPENRLVVQADAGGGGGGFERG